MFICENCGDNGSSDWCEECQELVACDHKEQTYTRFKDLTYDCDQGERTVTIRLHHCETCGETSHAEI